MTTQKMPITSKSTGVNTKDIKSDNATPLWLLATATLIGLVSYQFQTISSLSKELTMLTKDLNDIKYQVPSIRSNLTELISIAQLPSTVEPAVKPAAYDKLPFYATHIPTEPNNRLIPLEKDRMYSYDDFETVFGITPMHRVVINPILQSIMANHNALEDEQYLNDKINYDIKMEVYKDFFSQESHEEFQREHLGVKWSNLETGFGLYAKKDIPMNTILGFFTGVMQMDIDNTDYTWEVYKSQVTLPNGYTRFMDVGIDGRKVGNYLRFINHVGDSCNTKPEYVLFNNQWWVLYITEKNIVTGQELTTNYGSNYFDSRKRIYEGQNASEQH
ncbi:hypothetical protein BC833DRAFT_625378 [Globomyces pollinis-pini]|nr:hypothetical protein BC833DRAFT_625378 [Globomyces pollinis-pini]